MTANTTKPVCPRCEGSGSIETGIEEAPTELCRKCDGSGFASAASTPAMAIPASGVAPQVVAYMTKRGAIYGGEHFNAAKGDRPLCFCDDAAKQVAPVQVASDELLSEVKRFLEDMHAMPVDWTIRESQQLHAKVCAALAQKELGK